jgi:tetratricopeptide (TPR) repeat protein
MKKFFLKLIFFFVIVFTCFTLVDAEVKFADDNAVSETTNAADVYNLVLKAGYYANDGKTRKALSTFDEIFAQKPSLYVYELYFKLLFDIGETQKIVDIYKKKEVDFTKNFTANLDFWLVVAQSLLITNQDEKAEKIFVRLAKNFPDNEQVAYNYAMSMLKNNQPDKAIDYLKECIEKPLFKQRHFLFYFLRSKAYLQKNKLDPALKDIEKSLELVPQFDRGLLIKAMLLQQQGKVNEAVKGYKQFLSIVGRDEMVEKQIIQLLFLQKKFDDAAKYLKKLKGDTAEYYVELALIEMSALRHKQALAAINTSLKKSPNLINAKLLKIDILLAMKDYKQIMAFMHGWVDAQPVDSHAINTLLLLTKTSIQIKDITKLLEDISARRSTNIDILAALSDLYIEQKMYAKGLATYKKIHDLTVNDELKSKILFHTAYIHFTNNELEKAESVLQTALQKSPIAPQTYNMLAYIYAQKGTNLNKALEMSDKALESDKYSPFFMDTKGCILLKMGNYKDALDLFQRASNIAPGDEEILNHITAAKNQVLTEVKAAQAEIKLK